MILWLMIRFYEYFRSLLFKANYKELLISSSLIIFFLFINFFALTNLIYSSRGVLSLNNINHEAHDALGDVLATNEIAKILRLKAKNIWNSALISSTRSEVNAKIKNELLFCFSEFIYGKTKPFLVSFVCEHPVFKWPQCFDL